MEGGEKLQLLLHPRSEVARSAATSVARRWACFEGEVIIRSWILLLGVDDDKGGDELGEVGARGLGADLNIDALAGRGGSGEFERIR